MTADFDIKPFLQLRSEFPILQQQVNGNALIYLDNAATTQKPLSVIEAMDKYYRLHNANVHRASHYLSAEATRDFEAARTTVQQYIHAPSTDTIIWTRGTTEAINLVAQSWGRSHLKHGDEIVLTELEHHANIVPWQLLAEEIGFRINVLPILKTGELDMEKLPALLNKKTKLVSVCHVSNALGIINPVDSIIQQAHNIGAKVLIDGAQAIAHLPVDVQKLGCDFYVFSGHKMFGPTGIGVLYGKAELLKDMPPWQGGGEMIEKVSFSGTSYQKAPFKFEAGTPPIAEAIGLAAAIRFIQEHGTEALQRYENSLLQRAREALFGIPEVTLYGDVNNKVPVLSFTINGHHQKDVAVALDQAGIALRAGHHCTMPLMQALEIPGTLRASFSLYNSHQEVDILVNTLHSIIEGEPLNTPSPSRTEVYRQLLSLNNWDERYRQLMLLGKKATAPEKDIRNDENLISGCESQAWLSFDINANQQLRFYADSDAKIIRGLLALVTDLSNGKKAQEIIDTDYETIFAELGLQQHLSPSRGNGLLAITTRIKELAIQQLS